MARMQFSREDFERHVAEKGEVTVCDPAVGSGVMLLAFAKVVNAEFGRWGVNKLRLYGQDIDMRCVLMCKIQLRMNGLDTFGRLTGLFGGMNDKGEVTAGGTEHSQTGGRLLSAATSPAIAGTMPEEDSPIEENPRDQEGSEETEVVPDLEDAVVLQPGNTPQRKALMEQLTLF